METIVGVGEITVTESPHSLRAVGIGSCIAVVLYDAVTRLGGLAHIVLPYVEESRDKSQSAKFTNVAVGMMVDEMMKRNAGIQDIKAKIFGGANMFPEMIPPDSIMDIGKRNVAAARDELERYHIKIIAEEVGGHVGRAVSFDTRDGSVVVKISHSQVTGC